MDSLVKIKNDIKDRYKSINIDGYELLYTSNRVERIGIGNNKLINLSIDCNKGIAYRCITEEGLGEIFAEKIDSQTADNFFRYIITSSKFFARNKSLVLSDNTDKTIVDIKEFKVSNVEEKKKLALEIEDTCYNFDKRVVGIKNITLSSRQSYLNICNSNGVDYISEHGLETVLIQLLLKDNCTERDVVGMTWVDNLRNLNVRSIIGETIERGISLLGAEKIERGKYNVIFDAATSTKIWREFIPHFYANHEGASVNRLNTRIASSILNITDCANFNESYTNFLFDSEGVLVSDVEVVKNGMLQNYLHNQGTAKKFGTHSTGNGFKDSYSDNNKIKSKNLLIKNSNRGTNNLLEKLEDGILITEINNAISKRVDENGTILLVCSGHLIKNSQKVLPCQHICMSMNLNDFLNKIVGLGDDYYIRYSSDGTIIAPSVLIEDVLVT